MTTPNPETPPAALPAAGMTRRLAAMFYDVLLLFSVLFFAGLFAMLLADALGYSLEPGTNGWVSPLYQLYLTAVAYLYFAWPWVRAGQTLGMKAWRMRVQTEDGGLISWRQTVIRFLVAVLSWLSLGLGFGWALFDKEKRTWHDILSHTRLVRY